MITKTEKTVAAVFAVLVALALIAFFTVEPAYGQKPSSPPGQGESEHGNSGKPPREDPQPDRGKDCQEHGPKEGGVNEDHCAGTPTTPEETEPEETTPEETTPTTTEEEPSNPSAPEETEEKCIVPNDGTHPVDIRKCLDIEVRSGPPVILVPDDQPSVTATFEAEIQGELEKQAKANGASAAPVATTPSSAPDALPHTGLPLGLVALMGGALSAAGLYLRRRFPR